MINPGIAAELRPEPGLLTEGSSMTVTGPREQSIDLTDFAARTDGSGPLFIISKGGGEFRPQQLNIFLARKPQFGVYVLP